jgi:hypothetical protein
MFVYIKALKPSFICRDDGLGVVSFLIYLCILFCFKLLVLLFIHGYTSVSVYISKKERLISNKLDKSQ